MAPSTTYGPHNPHPLSQMRTELVWEGKYDEYGNRREVDVAGLAMPLQKIETIDQPRAEADEAGQLELFEKKSPRRDDFRNRLIWGDNKLVMASLLKEFKGQIDLIYIDPPFDVGADFTMQVPIGDEKETIEKDQSTLELVAYRDTWGRGSDSFIAMIYDRFVLARELLAETGSIYVHCDPRVNSLIRGCMDEIFGKENHLSEIVWKRTSARSDAVFWGPIHDTIYFYSKSSSYTWNDVYQKYDDSYLESKYTASDARGRYRTDNLTAAGLRGGDSGKPWRGIDPAQIGGH